MKYRVVLDTNQIVAAGSRWVMLDPPTPDERNRAQQVIHLVATSHTGLISSHIAGEYLRKLMDQGHPTERTTRFLGYLLGAFERVEVTRDSCSPSPTDPDDVIFLLCSLDGNADLLVSEDNHLLVLRMHYVKPEILPRDEAVVRLQGEMKEVHKDERAIKWTVKLRQKVAAFIEWIKSFVRR